MDIMLIRASPETGGYQPWHAAPENPAGVLPRAGHDQRLDIPLPRVGLTGSEAITQSRINLTNRVAMRITYTQDEDGLTHAKN